MFKVIETFDFYCDEFIEKYGIGEAKNDTFIEQVRYEISTDKSNELIHLELSTPTYDYKEPIPPGCVASRAGTTTLFLLGS